MKIAVVTDDQQTISAHFGRAQYYRVFTIENGEITAQESRTKPGHNQFVGEHNSHPEHNHEPHGTEPHSEERHGNMMEVIQDCQVLIACGMGMGAHNSLKSRNIQPFITDIPDVKEAVIACVAGTLIDHPERLH
jgi:predicted Fe-Mo cluster-binding NifX family protein